MRRVDVFLNGAGNSTITWDAAGGMVDPPRTQGVRPYEQVDAPVPTREGYRFGGWFTTEGAFACLGGAKTPQIGASVTYVAHWSEDGPRVVAHAPDGGTLFRGEFFADGGGSAVGSVPNPFETWVHSERMRLQDGQVRMEGVYVRPSRPVEMHCTVGLDSAAAGVEAAWVVATRPGAAVCAKWLGGDWESLGGYDAVDVYLNGAGASTVTWDGNGGVLAQPDGSFGPAATSEVMPYDVARDAPEPRRYGYAFAGWFDAPEGGSYVCGAGGSTGQVSSDATLYAHWALITSVEVPIALDSASFELGVPDGTVRVAGTDGDERAPGWLRSSMPVEVAVEAVSCEAALDASGASPGTPEAFWAEHAAFADLEVGPGEGAGGAAGAAGGDGAADGTAGAGAAAASDPSALAATGALSLRAGSSLAAPDLPPWLAIPAATGAPDGSMASLGELPLLYGLSLERLFADPAGGGAGVDIADLLPQAPGSGFAVPTGLLRVTFTVDATRYA